MLDKQTFQTRSRTQEFGLLLLFILIAMLWGGCFISTKQIAHSVTPLQGSAIRLLIAWVLIHSIYSYKKIPVALPKGVLPAVWFSGILLLAVPYILFFWGMKYISAGLGGLIEGSLPIFVVLLAWIFSSRKRAISRRELFGVALGMGGIVLIFLDKIELHTSSQAVLGMIFIVVEIISLALSTVLSRRLFTREKRLNTHAVFYQQTLASLVFILPFTLILDDFSSFSLEAVLSLPVIINFLYLGIFATALCNFGYILLIREWGSVRTGAIGYLIPVAAFLFDYLFFGNTPATLEVLGGSIIFIGITRLKPKAPIYTVKPKSISSSISIHDMSISAAS